MVSFHCAANDPRPQKEKLSGLILCFAVYKKEHLAQAKNILAGICCFGPAFYSFVCPAIIDRQRTWL